MTERFPHFFLVGAPKAATTSIYEYMKRHPEIFVPSIKEPHFFSCPEVKDTYYEVAFVESEEDYRSLYAGTDGYICGDFSPSYLYRERAASRIKAWSPNAQILLILRNPIERAISHYLMDLRAGYQTRTLNSCLTRDSGTEMFYREYIEVGRYASQVKRYHDVFGTCNVHVFFYDDLISDALEVLSKMYKAIGVDPHVSSGDLGQRRNTHRVFRSAGIRRAVSTRSGQLIVRNSPAWLKNKVSRILSSTEKPDFANERHMLREIFEDDIRDLETVVSRDLSGWLA